MTHFNIIIMGSFSNDDDDGSENVAEKKISLHPLYHVYLVPHNLSNVGNNFSWTWILKDFIEFHMFTSPIKRCIRRFHANMQ